MLTLIFLSLFAQTRSPLGDLQRLQTLNQRTTEQQVRLDVNLPDIAGAYVDGVIRVAQNIYEIYGWGLACGFAPNQVRIVIVIDDIETQNVYTRFARPDVNAVLQCSTGNSNMVGVHALIDVSDYQPGFNFDEHHMIELRVYPPLGAPVFKMKRSAPFEIVP